MRHSVKCVGSPGTRRTFLLIAALALVMERRLGRGLSSDHDDSPGFLPRAAGARF